MLKILFAILKLFPQGLALIQQHNAAENQKLEKGLADYKLKALSDAAEIEKLQQESAVWKAESNGLAARARVQMQVIAERDAQIERLHNETQQRLKAVAAMDSESVFSASLSLGPVGAKLENIKPAD